MAATSPIIDSLFTPRSTALSLRETWPELALSAHGPLERLPPYLRSETLRSFAHLAARYHGRISFGNAATGTGTAVAYDVPATLLRQMGLSLYLPDLAACVPGTDDFLRALEQELGAQSGSARIGAFAAAVHNGVTSHYDAEEVISVQLEGSKRFYIAPMREIRFPYGMQFGPGYEAFDDLYPQMDAGVPRPHDAEFECIEMRPGSVLFMPRGTWHRTEATEESYSVSIILRQPAAFEGVLEQLRRTLLRDPAWRRPLYAPEHRRETQRGHLAELLADLPRTAATFGADEVITALLPEPARRARIDEHSWLQRVPSARLSLTPLPQSDTAQASVTLTQRDGGERDVVQLQVPPALRPVFQYLAQEERPLRAGALAVRHAAVPFAQIKTVLDLLLRAGYLTLLRHMPRQVDGGND